MWTLPSLLTRWSTNCFAYQIKQVLAVVGRALLALVRSCNGPALVGIVLRAPNKMALTVSGGR